MGRGKANATDVLDDILADTKQKGGAPRKVASVLAQFSDEHREKIEACMRIGGPEWSDRRVANVINRLAGALDIGETVSAGAVTTHREKLRD